MLADEPFIDPELVAAQQLLKQCGLVALSPMTSPIAEARAALGRISAFLNEGSVPLARERDLFLTGPHGPVPCRLYLPDGAERPPLLVYAHGGSFALGDLDGWDGALRALVRGSGVAVLAVDYRLAPEYRFPVASDEMVAMIRLMAREGADHGIDPTRVAAGGDSAGANLALGAALALRAAGDPALRFLLLNYGAYSTDNESPSWRRFGTGAYGLAQAQLGWIWNNYLASDAQKSDWRVAPLGASMQGLPPTFLAIGSLDPLQDDNRRLAERLTADGVPCTLVTYDGLNHGYIRYGRLIAAVRRAIADGATALRAAMERPVGA
jgi:acetyl esterase